MRPRGARRRLTRALRIERSFDGGTSAANLPGVLTAGGSVFDLTDPVRSRSVRP